MIGRTREWESVVHAVHRPPAVVVVEGEAGIGKSRLVREVTQHLDGGDVTVLIGLCHPSREPFPYGPVVDALRSTEPHLAAAPALNPVLGALRFLLPELAEHLPPRPAPTGDSRTERHRLFRAIRELLALLGPVLLVVEDMHWADDGTRQLTRFLLADPPPGLTVLITYRPEDTAGTTSFVDLYRPSIGTMSAVCALEPLSPEHVRRLIEGVVGVEEVSADFATRLHGHTGGNPFVIEEVLWSLPDPVAAVRTTGVHARRLLDGLDTPLLLREIAAERLAAIPTSARRLVQVASVLGVPTNAGLLAEVAGVPADRAAAAIDHAVTRHLLRRHGADTYSFRNEMARRSVYEGINGPDRQRWHLRAVEALERLTPVPLPRLAEHSKRAGHLADWLRYGEAAADEAVDSGDVDTALTLLRQLVSEPETDAIDRLTGKLGAVACLAVDQQDSADALSRLLSSGRLSAAAEADARLRRGILLLRQSGTVVTARSEIESVIREANAETAAHGASLLAHPMIGDRPGSETRSWLDRADTHPLARAATESGIALLTTTLTDRILSGDNGFLNEFTAMAAATTERRHMAHACVTLAGAATTVGHLDTASTLLRSGLALIDDRTGPYITDMAAVAGAHLDWLTGKWSGLDERLHTLLADTQHLLPVATEANLLLGSLSATRGEWTSAVPRLLETGVRAPSESVAPTAIAGFAELTGVRLAQHDPHTACVHVDRGVDLLRHKGVWSWAGGILPAAVSTYLAVGRDSDAADLVDEVAAHIAGHDLPMAAAGVDTGRGMVATLHGDATGAAEHFQRARERYESIGAVYHAARVGEQAVMCLAHNEVTPAPALYSLIDVFETLGAHRDAARCKRALREAGTIRVERRGRRGYGSELSPREREVARLLAGGHTNREIADALFVSQKTVEYHVSKVLRKYNISSRSELAAVCDVRH